MEKNWILGIARYTLVIICIVFFDACSLPYTTSNSLLTPQEHLNLGVAYEHSHDFDAARKEYALASREMPIAYLYLGNIHFQRGQFNEAEKTYRKAINKTHDPHAYNNLAWLYYIRNVKLEEAEELAMRAIDADPQNEEFGDTLTKIREKRMMKAIGSGLEDEKR